jgi:hypothetical protein
MMRRSRHRVAAAVAVAATAVALPARIGAAAVEPRAVAGVATRHGAYGEAGRAGEPARVGRRVHFSGTVRPPEVNRPLAIQRRRRGRWVTITGTVTRPGRADFALYGKTIPARRSGLYRVFVGAGIGATAPNVGRTVRLRISR